MHISELNENFDIPNFPTPIIGTIKNHRKGLDPKKKDFFLLLSILNGTVSPS